MIPHPALAQMKTFPKSDDFAVLLGKARSFSDSAAPADTPRTSGIIESKIGTSPPRSEQHKVDIMNLLYVRREPVT
jgi:hypothetical protein